MKTNLKNKKGITLIALVVTIIILMIIAGVSINLLFRENGIITQAKYATFINEMSSVEEAVKLWKLDQANTAIPTNGLCKQDTLSNSERLEGEVGYYRIWSTSQTKPTMSVLKDAETFNSAYEAEIVYFPAGTQDLYYLNNEEIGANKNKEYLIDAVNGMIYSTKGITLNGVRVYSLQMAKAVMSGTSESPEFIEAEVSGTGVLGEKLAGNVQSEYLADGTPNPNYNPYGFQIVVSDTNSNTNNIYKLYNNGDLYGKGVKGIGLQTSDSAMNKIDSALFQELKIPEEIPSVKKIIPGESGTIYVIDNDGELWAWGNNNSNKLALTEEQQASYTEREAIKLNVDNKKVYTVFDNSDSSFVVTEDNKLYAAGKNSRGNLGIGNIDVVYNFTQVESIDNPKSIFQIYSNNTYGTLLWYNDAPSNIEVRSDEWCTYNKFYFTGYSGWGFGGINNSNPPKYTQFSRIWDGNDGEDLDHRIKYAGHAAFPRILLTDGTFMQSGFGGSGTSSGAIGGGTKANFFTRTEAVGHKFEKMWYGNETVILLDDENNLWGVSRNNTGVIGDTTRDWVLDKLENVPFDVSKLKEVQVTENNVFYLLNDNSVYATGNYSYLGLGDNWASSISGFVCLSSGKYAKSFPKVSTLYGGTVNGYEVVKEENSLSQTSNNIFIGQDGKIYMTGNSTLMFRNDILEKNWVLVANNVKYFDANSPAYIDKNGNLYVAGSSSGYLGLGYEVNQKVKKFTEITDSRIKGKAKKVMYDNNVMAVLTEDNILYASGQYMQNEYYCYPGWTTTQDNQLTFIEVMQEVEDFNYNGYSRLIKKVDGSVYGFGFWRQWIQTASANTPTKVNTITTEIKGLYPMSRHSYVLDIEGKLYYSGDSNYYGGMEANTNDYIEFTGNINGEKVKDIVTQHDSSNHIILTENGNLYGWGNYNKLGIGNTSTDITKTITKLPITNVESIAAGKNFYIAIKKDGTVWATGSNQSGVLGRWTGVNRDFANSRYKTAFEWVECPELEI